MFPPVQFLPANTRPAGAIVVNDETTGFLYAVTTHGCAYTPDAVWAVDLISPKKDVVSWEARGATIAGSAGPAFGRDGTIYVATRDGNSPLSNSVVALEPKTLKQKAVFTLAKADFVSAPIVIQHKEKDLVAVAAKDGRIFVLDGATLQVPLATTRQPESSPAKGWRAGRTRRGPAGSWRRDRARWWPTGSSRRALASRFRKGWTSRALVAPLTPLVVNGVVFALSSGEGDQAGAAARAGGAVAGGALRPGWRQRRRDLEQRQDDHRFGAGGSLRGCRRRLRSRDRQHALRVRVPDREVARMPRSCWIVRASWLAGAALVIAAGSSASAQTRLKLPCAKGSHGTSTAPPPTTRAGSRPTSPRRKSRSRKGEPPHRARSPSCHGDDAGRDALDDSGPGIRDIREGVRASPHRARLRRDRHRDHSQAEHGAGRISRPIPARSRMRSTASPPGPPPAATCSMRSRNRRTLVRREAVRPVSSCSRSRAPSTQCAAGQVSRTSRSARRAMAAQAGMKTMTSWNQRPTTIHEALDETIAAAPSLRKRRAIGRPARTGRPGDRHPTRLRRSPTSCATSSWSLRQAAVGEAGGEDRGHGEAPRREGPGAEVGG